MPSGLMPGGQACCGARRSRRRSSGRCRSGGRRTRGSGGGTGAGLAPLVMPLSALP